VSPTVVPASFRDPAGFVWSDGGRIYRHVGDDHREHYDKLLSSGLYDALTKAGLMVKHTESDSVASPRSGAYKVLEPEVVPFISYPYEWSFSQLKDAALCTLEIQKIAIEHGMTLRDATAYNIQFVRGRPALIDTLSLGVLPEGQPWIAYRQFCKHFLAPLALMAHVDVSFGSMSRLYIDGVPLEFASDVLPRRTRYNPGLLAHVHTQARVSRRHAAAGEPPKQTTRQLSLQQLKGIVWSLERAVRKLEWSLPKTAWRDYYQEATHYSPEAHRKKQDLVGSFLDDAGGSTVWDLGGNVGLFSRVATAKGRNVVCFDIDPGCVESNYRKVVEDSEPNLLPLLCDLTNPSPGLGWAHRERASLVDRGPADALLALALIHHLSIGNNVPFPLVAEYFAELGSALIIEFVPKSDPMVQTLLATREDIFTSYHQPAFEEAFAAHFAIELQRPIEGTERVLYLMRKK
jgi:hypothetical protein